MLYRKPYLVLFTSSQCIKNFHFYTEYVRISYTYGIFNAATHTDLIKSNYILDKIIFGVILQLSTDTKAKFPN